MAFAFNSTIRNAGADAITTNAGTSAQLKFYTGTRPATGAAITSQVLLATLTCGAASFAPAASGGVLTLSNITSAAAVATGTTTWARIVKSDGTTFVADANVAASGSDININSTAISSGATVSVTNGATITMGNA